MLCTLTLSLPPTTKVYARKKKNLCCKDNFVFCGHGFFNGEHLRPEIGYYFKCYFLTFSLLKTSSQNSDAHDNVGLKQIIRSFTNFIVFFQYINKLFKMSDVEDDAHVQND